MEGYLCFVFRGIGRARGFVRYLVPAPRRASTASERVSRSFVCGGAEPTRVQRDVYGAAHEWIQGMTELIRPGVTCAELAAAAPEIPERFLDQRYEVMVHGVGLEEESPSVCHPQDEQSNPGRQIDENMALVVEIYAGEVGALFGVKLGDEVLVTGSGSVSLAPYPYSAALLDRSG